MFKRNQVEEAIITIWGPEPAKHASRLRGQIKRLLETDRNLGRNKRSADPARSNFAFYSADMPGRGHENWFSAYEAFALLTGLRLMRHNWPQRFAVTLLRRNRQELEKEHARILAQDPAVLFDQQLIMQEARPGAMVIDNTDPVFLGIISENRSDGRGAINAAICRGQASLLKFLKSHGVGQTLTSFEFATSVHVLSNALAKTTFRRRGRASA